MIFKNAKRNALNMTAAVIAIAFSVIFPLHPVRAISGGGLIAYPTTSDPDNELSQTWFIYDLPAGESKEDYLTVKNDTEKEVSVSLYAVDSTANNMGEFALEEERDSRDLIGKWIALETDRLTLKSGEEKQVKFTIRIPADAASGEVSGGIIIQKDLTEAQKNATSGFVINTRIGIRVYETVPGDTVRKATIRNAFAGYNESDGVYAYAIVVKNDGNVSLNANIKLDLKDGFFRKQGAQLEQKVTIPRGEEQKVVFALDSAHLGRFDAVAQIGYEDSNGQDIIVSAPVVSFFAYPRDLVLALGALLLLNILLFAFLRFKKAIEKKNYVDYRLQNGDNLENLSARLGISWKKIAKLNKLKPPYQLEEGQTIRLLDKKHVLSEAAARNAMLQEPTETFRRSRQEAFEKDLALISDDKPAIYLRDKETSGASKAIKKIFSLVLVLGVGYFAYSQLVIKGNDAHFTYDRGLTNLATKQEKETDEIPAAEDAVSTEAHSAAENTADGNPPTGEEDVTTAARQETAIKILNGSGAKGAGGKAAVLFKEKGYASVTAGNAERFDYAETSIVCGKAVIPAICEETKSLVASRYPSARIAQDDSAAGDNEIVIILGK